MWLPHVAYYTARSGNKPLPYALPVLLSITIIIIHYYHGKLSPSNCMPQHPVWEVASVASLNAQDVAPETWAIGYQAEGHRRSVDKERLDSFHFRGIVRLVSCPRNDHRRLC